MLLLRITVLEFSALLQHSIAIYCVLPVNTFYILTMDDVVFHNNNINTFNIHVHVSNSMQKSCHV